MNHMTTSCEGEHVFFKVHVEYHENVYHLKGGILDYLEKIPEADSKWHGECFVFDERVSLRHGLETGDYGLCRGCRHPLTEEETQSEYYEKGVSCHRCYNESTEAQKSGFRERQKQMELARLRKLTKSRNT